MFGEFYIRHPLEVGPHRVHLARVHTDATELQERSLCVVHAAEAVPIAVVCHLVVIPRGNPCEILVGQTKIRIGTILSNARAIVIKGEDLATGCCCSWVSTSCASAGLVDVISKMNLCSQSLLGQNHAAFDLRRSLRCLCVLHCHKR